MLFKNMESNLMEESNKKFNVVVGDKVKRTGVPKSVAESYINTLTEAEQSQASIVPVTDDGKEILFG